MIDTLSIHFPAEYSFNALDRYTFNTLSNLAIHSVIALISFQYNLYTLLKSLMWCLDRETLVGITQPECAVFGCAQVCGFLLLCTVQQSGVLVGRC